MFRSKAARKVLVGLDHWMIRQFDRVVVLGQNMRQVMVAKGVADDRIAVIHNWPLVDSIAPTAKKDNALLAGLGLADKFVVQYSGNMGVVHDMAPLIDGAIALKSNDKIAFLVIGDGQRRVEVERARQKHSLTNMILLPYQPADQLNTSLNAADVAYVSLRPEMEGLVVPSKTYGHLAAGVPILFAGDKQGEVARIVDQFQCGAWVRNGGELASTINSLVEGRQLLARWRKNARLAFENNFRRETAISSYRTLFGELAAT
jgi:glycosyltransferase involved in cell wall biosynthesis